MSQPRTILLCSSALALPTLQELAFFQQLAVVVIPAYCKDMIGEVQAILTGMEIPVVLVKKETNEQQLIEAIEKYNANIGLMITFPYLIPSNVYVKTDKGFYNVHPGPLPAYRGADPIFQQVKNREKKAGVSLHLINEEADSGPMVMQEMIHIDASDTYGIVSIKLAQVAAKLVRSLLKLVDFDLAVPSRPQDESQARYYKKQAANEIVINWETMDAPSIVALINACNPWNKGAVTKLNQKIIRLLEAEVSNEPFLPNELAGTIIRIDEQGMFIATCSKQLLWVKIIYMDEGYLVASRLQQFGLPNGSRFQSV